MLRNLTFKLAEGKKSNMVGLRLFCFVFPKQYIMPCIFLFCVFNC
jgi:hypothetical protein